MSHDPLCPEASGDFNVLPKPLGGAMYVLLCECHLIARVRDDERRRYIDGLDRIIQEVDTAERKANHLINPTGYDPAATDNRP